MMRKLPAGESIDIDLEGPVRAALCRTGAEKVVADLARVGMEGDERVVVEKVVVEAAEREAADVVDAEGETVGPRRPRRSWMPTWPIISPGQQPQAETSLIQHRPLLLMIWISSSDISSTGLFIEASKVSMEIMVGNADLKATYHVAQHLKTKARASQRWCSSR
jgi:hypothetical protein